MQSGRAQEGRERRRRRGDLEGRKNGLLFYCRKEQYRRGFCWNRFTIKMADLPAIAFHKTNLFRLNPASGNLVFLIAVPKQYLCRSLNYY